MRSRWFYVGALALVLFEIANVWFVMPLPGSQRMRSIEVAYAIYQWRWAARALCGFIALLGVVAAFRSTRWRALAAAGVTALAGAVLYGANFRMAADHMFRQPKTLTMASVADNAVARDRLVVGVERNGEARAYPLAFIGYHHQVRDRIANEDILVSYCTVCRTGRVFTPTVRGKPETFRLVGMDHWNAMFEDQTTKSWWRQANGEAVTGPLKGEAMPEVPSIQVTLDDWIALHPQTLVMQADPAFVNDYAKDYSFEKGTSRKDLTGTDTTSWGEKSWVVGIALGSEARAYDWNDLKRQRVINDELGGIPLVITLGADGASFYAFERPSREAFSPAGDSIVGGTGRYALNGRGVKELKRVPASQEFWHSWRTFHPTTSRYSPLSP